MPFNIKFKRGTASEWNNSAFPSGAVLSLGEPGFEKDTGKLKIGNGTTPWALLPYVGADDEVIRDLVAAFVQQGSGIGIAHDDNTNTLTINVSGLDSSYISDFNEAVDDRVGSGLFVGGTGILLSYNDISNSFVVSTTGLSLVGHSHVVSDITDFASGVSGLLPVKNILGSGYIITSNNSGTYNIGVTGLQPSGNYSVVGHTHTTSDITNFNSSVSGLFPTISNSGDNRILTSTGSVNGINGESNLTFNGSLLNITGSGVFTESITGASLNIDNLKIDGNTISSISGNVTISPSGTGDVYIDADTLRVGDSNSSANITTNGTGGLTVNVNGGTNSGALIIQYGPNADVILAANNAGAIRSVNAGNARGLYSTDWQRNFNTADRVAAGIYSVIAGGYNNKSSNDYSIVAGGYQNTASANHAVVGGGQLNTVSSNDSVICGGYNNLITANHCAIAGGLLNNNGGAYSFIGGGEANSTEFNSSHCVINGGKNNSISPYTLFATVGGASGVASLYGEQAYSAGSFNNAGDAETRKFILRGRDNTSTTVNLKLDGNTSGIQYLYVPPWTSWYFTIKVVGRRNGGWGSGSTSNFPSETAVYKFEGGIENRANDGFSNCFILPDAASTKTVIHEDDAGWDCNISIEQFSNDPYLNIACSYNSASEDVYWVASVEVVQVSVPIQGPSAIIACGFIEPMNGSFTSGGFYNNREYYQYSNNTYYLFWTGTEYVISTSLGGSALYTATDYTQNDWTQVGGSGPGGDTYDMSVTSVCPSAPTSSSSSSGSSTQSSSSSSSSSN